MKLLVPFKRVPDTTSVLPGGGADAARWIINPLDEVAIEEALRLRERGEAEEIVGVTIAPAEADEQIRHAFAMGLDRAIRVEDARALDPYAVSRILAAVVRREHPDLVILGKQAVDDDAGQVGQMLAGLLDWPQATFLSRLELAGSGRQARCTRETDAGPEVLLIDLPAVVTADLRLNEPRYVSLPGLIKARRRSIELLTLEELGTRAVPLTSVLSIEDIPPRARCTFLKSVDEVIVRLREQEKVL